jgi:dTDP-4-amino-4,6-dideoxygalactose transaminase
MKIPFGRPLIGEEEKKVLLEVLEGPTLVHGEKIRCFEKDFAVFTGARRAVAVSSCTAAMHLFYLAKGLKAGDEVIVPALTHTATAHAVAYCGARPVFADADPETGNIDLDQVEGLINGRTRGFCVVHYRGFPVDMDRANLLCERYGLFCLEDAALALGSYWRGRHAGLLSEGACFSFYPVKHMTTAEGGMFITENEELADRIAHLRAFGVDRSPAERKEAGIYDVTALGFNYRLNELQAALGIEQLKKLPDFLKIREKNYQILRHRLAQVKGISLFREGLAEEKSAYYCLVIRLGGEKLRKALADRLKFLGVGTSVYYPGPLPAMTCYRRENAQRAFPVAENISKSSLALPVGPHLNEKDMIFIADSIEEILKELL